MQESRSCLTNQKDSLKITANFSQDHTHQRDIEKTQSHHQSAKRYKRRVIIVEPTAHSIISGEVKVNPSECEHALFGKSLEDLTPPSDLFEHDSTSQGFSKQSPRAVAEFKNYTSGGV